FFPLMLTFGLMNIAVAQTQTGLTGVDFDECWFVGEAMPAQLVIPEPLQPLQPSFYGSPWLRFTDDWELIAADSLTASIPIASHLTVCFDPAAESLSFYDPTALLSATQIAAIERAPAWLRFDLYDNFRRFEYPVFADLVAMEVLDAPDPYVDEVAFQAAHLAPGILGGGTYLQLLLENAQYVYTADSALDYVEILDFGSSSDDDYWSTARYNIIEESGDTVQVTIDRETYYWYVVHPKVSDETPTYINPENGNPHSPPLGVFWRTYYWTHADSSYPLLSEQLENCDFLWAHLTNTAGSSNGAVGLVNDWVNDVMNWGVGYERPIQPVRIYALHTGYCGEHSDITAAAGRTALIPTVCTTDYCEDHTWNEFWDREWIAWEPVNNYVNSPLVYENGWGKVISAVFDWRGDGYVWTVTDLYSEDVCLLNVTVTDSAGKPADGTRIKVYNEALWGGLYYATWGITNSLGQVSFTLGDAQNFYLRVEGPLGSYPEDPYATVNVITNSGPGDVYNWEYSFNATAPSLEIEQAQEYPDPLDAYRMEISFQCNFESVYGTYFTYNEFAEQMTTGWADFFVVNEQNFNAYNAATAASGFSILDNTQAGFVDFVLPTQEPWYAVLSTRELSKNHPCFYVTANVYRNTLAAGADPASNAPQTYRLEAPYPNPCNQGTVIRFIAPKSERLTVAVYNLQGQEVAVLFDQTATPGEHQVVWAGGDERNLPAASGIYLVRLTTAQTTLTQKICLLK
ncbi:MAG: T9SS type A sorting domain-containing protein, partial [bacterium]